MGNMRIPKMEKMRIPKMEKMKLTITEELTSKHDYELDCLREKLSNELTASTTSAEELATVKETIVKELTTEHENNIARLRGTCVAHVFVVCLIYFFILLKASKAAFLALL